MIRELLDQKNMKKISKELDIPPATLYRWVNEEGIERQVKFIKLLYRLGIDPKEYINKYEQSKANKYIK